MAAIGLLSFRAFKSTVRREGLEIKGKWGKTEFLPPGERKQSAGKSKQEKGGETKCNMLHCNNLGLTQWGIYGSVLEMAPNAIHAEYAASAGAWSRARDVIAGEDAVKAAGERYLPKLDSQSADEYAAYKMRALFFSATARTADGFVGLIFRRAPFVRGLGDETTKHTNDTKVANEAPSPPPSPSLRRTGQPSPPTGRGSSALGKAMAGFSNDADMLGTSLYGYAKNVVTEVISVGRAGTLVDWEGEVEDRAYATLYAAEDILNWRMERINGRNLLTMVALHEVADGKEQMADGKEDEAASVEQIRVVRLELIRICFLVSNIRNCRHAVMEHCFLAHFHCPTA